MLSGFPLCNTCRMLWSFSRDGGVWLYRVWARVNSRTHTPVNAVWAMTSLAFLLGLAMLWSSTTFQIVGSMASFGLFISCEPSQLHCAPLSLLTILLMTN